MAQDYFSDFADMANKLNAPLQSLAALNMRTLQGLEMMKPEEFTAIKKPEEWAAKQLELTLSNGRKGLHYMQESLGIMDQCLAIMSKPVDRKKTKG